MISSDYFDVLVIGGGPAGTTIATLLAEKGWSVCLLEKNHHPRFHIGESLLPLNLPILERLGVLDAVNAIGVKKIAAEFNSTETGLAQDIFYFANAIDKNHPYSYQVRRSEFDQLLFNNCQSKGVCALQGVCVTDVVFEKVGKVRIDAKSETEKALRFTARYVVDASGRDTFLAKKFKQKRKNSKHQMVAIYGHFSNVVRRQGHEEGNISIYWFEQGWIWLIPLPDGVMSVGVVCWPSYLKSNKTSLELFLMNTLKQLPLLAERMQNAKLIGQVQATGNYSYASSSMASNSYLLVGDAFAFVDPVFSSGVFLAMQGATDGAELVDQLLTGSVSSKEVIRRYEKKVNRGMAAMSWFIYRFNTPVLHRLLMSSDDSQHNYWQLKMKAAVISILSGDIYGNKDVALPLFLFKTLYYFLCLKNFSATLRLLRFKAGQGELRGDDGC